MSVQYDTTTLMPASQKNTSGAAHVLLDSGSGTVLVAASVDANAAVAADVDAAVAAATGLRLIGFASRESAATAAVASFVIVHGATAAGGTSVVPVELKADESTREWFGPDGIACPNGISIDWIAGTADINLFYKIAA